ncbi:hypothetical protein K431DRAFT_299321 [Polychaeton citri CBS 116435]|uniref:General transcription and DNA repair factor IIH subunit TFB5 n=1 Tax=Polychaeton citri CBS 116435 TaxID=1314669 RepID=A0A9P4UVI8_9PEZI|nr:hypothetical protein K431DRAFT_299321 [Polychaeton citri CBS 116435]
MPTATAGVLVKCDPSIRAILMKIDNAHQNQIISEEVDDDHLLIKNAKFDELKILLKQANTVREPEESGSDKE